MREYIMIILQQNIFNEINYFYYFLLNTNVNYYINGYELKNFKRHITQ